MNDGRILGTRAIAGLEGKCRRRIKLKAKIKDVAVDVDIIAVAEGVVEEEVVALVGVVVEVEALGPTLDG